MSETYDGEILELRELDTRQAEHRAPRANPELSLGSRSAGRSVPVVLGA